MRTTAPKRAAPLHSGSVTARNLPECEPTVSAAAPLPAFPIPARDRSHGIVDPESICEARICPPASVPGGRLASEPASAGRGSARWTDAWRCGVECGSDGPTRCPAAWRRPKPPVPRMGHATTVGPPPLLCRSRPHRPPAGSPDPAQRCRPRHPLAPASPRGWRPPSARRRRRLATPVPATTTPARLQAGSGRGMTEPGQPHEVAVSEREGSDGARGPRRQGAPARGEAGGAAQPRGPAGSGTRRIGGQTAAQAVRRLVSAQTGRRVGAPK